MNAHMVAGGVLFFLSFAYPLEHKKDVFARGVFFILGGLLIMEVL